MVKKLVKKIALKHLKGDVVFNNAMWDKYGPNFAEMARSYNFSEDYIKGVRRFDVNVIYDVHRLQHEVDLANLEALIAGLVYVANKEQGRQLLLCAPDTSGPSLTLADIDEMTKLVAAPEAILSIEKLKEKIRAEYRTGVNLEESCP
jgi:hypothetical protein